MMSKKAMECGAHQKTEWLFGNQKTKDGVLGFYILEKGIKYFFVGDSRSRSMAWVDIVVWKGEELGLDTMKELFHATCR